MSRTRINEDDAPDLQSDAEAAVHAADTTSVHGIADTSTLSTTAHDHDADYEAAGGIATHSADSTAVHGITDTSALVVDGDAAGGELAGTYPNPTVAAAHSGSTHAATQAAAEATAAGALSAHEADTTAVHGIADTANLSAVGHAHAGEDITSGTVADARIAAALARDTEVATAVSDHEAAANPHATYLTQAEGDAAYEAIGATATHAAAGDPHTGYRLESADHSHASTGLQAGTIAHTALTGVTSDQHHAQVHATAHQPGGGDAMAVDAAAATGSLRTLGTGAAQAAAGDHTHGGSNPWTTIIKTGDTARTNNTVSPDPDLVVTLLANTNYTIFFRVFMITNATADARYQLTFSGTTTRVRRQILRTATADVPALVATGAAFDAAPVVLSTTGISPYVEERVVLQVGASGGSFAFQWAQVTTNGSPCTVLEGSYLEYAVT